MSPFCIFEEGGEQCGRKVENRELGLCATHNKARRVAERPVAPPKVYNWKPRAAIPAVSKGMAATLREQKKTYAAVDAAEPEQCVSCGHGGKGLQHSHVLPKGTFQKHRNNPFNILLECPECHHTWEHHKHDARRLHASWNRKLEIIQALEPKYYTKFVADFGGPT